MGSACYKWGRDDRACQLVHVSTRLLPEFSFAELIPSEVGSESGGIFPNLCAYSWSGLNPQEEITNFVQWAIPEQKWNWEKAAQNMWKAQGSRPCYTANGCEGDCGCHSALADGCTLIKCAENCEARHGPASFRLNWAHVVPLCTWTGTHCIPKAGR